MTRQPPNVSKPCLLKQKIQHLEDLLKKRSEGDSPISEIEQLYDIIKSMKQIIQRESEDPIRYKQSILQSHVNSPVNR